VAEYQDLGPALKIGEQDGTLGSPINPFLPGTGWNVIFRPQDIFTKETDFELYHVFLAGPIGSSCQVLRDGHAWDFVNQGFNNSWDPAQPMPLHQTNELEFCWNVPFAAGPYNLTSNIQPSVTIWLRAPIPVGQQI
jgi:hypothetical protein